MRLCRRGEKIHPPAIHGQGLRGDETGFVRNQEKRGVGNVQRFSQPAEHGFPGRVFHPRTDFRLRQDSGLQCHVRPDQARSNRINGNIEGTHFHGHSFGQNDQACLGSSVGAGAGKEVPSPAREAIFKILPYFRFFMLVATA